MSAKRRANARQKKAQEKWHSETDATKHCRYGDNHRVNSTEDNTDEEGKTCEGGFLDFLWKGEGIASAWRV